MATKKEYRTLSREQLDMLAGEPLPARAANSLINAKVAVPLVAALAPNILSHDSVAVAESWTRPRGSNRR